LSRSSASGGGSRSATKISEQLYGRAFGDLDSHERDVVLTQQQNEHKWCNNHANSRVFTTACGKTVRALEGAPHGLCDACTLVHSSKAFKKALAVATPAAHNYIFNNLWFRNSEL
ncbi:hypothetical protein K439DRAFT_1265648, partial [Ramaria rubella]